MEKGKPPPVMENSIFFFLIFFIETFPKTFSSTTFQPNCFDNTYIHPFKSVRGFFITDFFLMMPIKSKRINSTLCPILFSASELTTYSILFPQNYHLK